MSRPVIPRNRRPVYGAMLIAAALGACASAPVAPTPAMTKAEAAIDQARKSGAEQLASDSFRNAESELAAAKSASANHSDRLAADLVDEASADARLADLQSQAVKASKAAAEVDKSIRTLEVESARVKSP
jgi:hypothetical protein